MVVVQIRAFFFSRGSIKRKLIPVKPLLFQRANDDVYTGCGEDSKGNINYLYHPIRSRISAFRKLPWYETIPFQLSLAGFCAVPNALESFGISVLTSLREGKKKL